MPKISLVSIIIIIVINFILPPVSAQNLYQCEWQADGSGCWKIVNYTDYAVECDDYYNNDICWVQCGDYECGGGQSDNDQDGIPNNVDPDDDNDLIPDSIDQSDYSAEDYDGCQDSDGTPEPSSACGGGYTYPTPGTSGPSSCVSDFDHDNICDSQDVDDDNDGFPDLTDQCDFQAGTYNGCSTGNIPPPNPGCVDSDWDGTCNDQDPCPNQVGSPVNRGCPYVPPQNPQPAPPSAPQGPEPPISEEPPAIPPSAYFSNWKEYGEVGEVLYFQARADGSDLAQMDILIADSADQLNSSSSWTVLGSRSCSGTSCILESSWVPDSGDGGKNFVVVVNAYDTNGLQCSGNRISDHPEFWNDCSDGETDIRNVAIAEVVELAPAPAPAPSPSPSKEPINLPNSPPVGEQPNEQPTTPENPPPEVPAQDGCLPLLQYFCPITNQCQWNYESCSQPEEVQPPGEQPVAPENPSQPVTSEVAAPICHLGDSYGVCQQDTDNGLAYGTSYCLRDSSNQIKIDCLLDTCSNGGNPPVCQSPETETTSAPVVTPPQSVIQPEIPSSPVQLGEDSAEPTTPEVPAESTSGVAPTVPTITALHTFINGVETPLNGDAVSFGSDIKFEVEVPSSLGSDFACRWNFGDAAGDTPPQDCTYESVFPGGLHTVSVYVVNNAGEQSSKQSVTFAVKPKLQITSINTSINNASVNLAGKAIQGDQTITFTANVPSELGQDYACRWDLGSGFGTNEDCTTSDRFGPGNYTIKVYLVNNSGEESEESSLKFTVLQPPPPPPSEIVPSARTDVTVAGTVSVEKEVAEKITCQAVGNCIVGEDDKYTGQISYDWVREGGNLIGSTTNCPAKQVQDAPDLCPVEARVNFDHLIGGFTNVIDVDGKRTVTEEVQVGPQCSYLEKSEAYDCSNNKKCFNDFFSSQATGCSWQPLFHSEGPFKDKNYHCVTDDSCADTGTGYTEGVASCVPDKSEREGQCYEDKRLVQDFYRDNSTNCLWTSADPSFHLKADPTCLNQDIVNKECESRFECGSGYFCQIAIGADKGTCQADNSLSLDQPTAVDNRSIVEQALFGVGDFASGVGNGIGTAAGFIGDRAHDLDQFIVGGGLEYQGDKGDLYLNTSIGLVNMVTALGHDLGDVLVNKEGVLHIPTEDVVKSALESGDAKEGLKLLGIDLDAADAQGQNYSLGFCLGDLQNPALVVPLVGGALSGVARTFSSSCISHDTFLPSTTGGSLAATVRAESVRGLAREMGLNLDQDPNEWDPSTRDIYFDKVRRNDFNLAKSTLEMIGVPVATIEDARNAQKICEDSIGKSCFASLDNPSVYTEFSESDFTAINERATKLNPEFIPVSSDLFQAYAQVVFGTSYYEQGQQSVSDIQRAREDQARKLNISLEELANVEATYQAYGDAGKDVKENTSQGKLMEEYSTKATLETAIGIVTTAIDPSITAELIGGAVKATIAKSALQRLVKGGEEKIADEVVVRAESGLTKAIARRTEEITAQETDAITQLWKISVFEENPNGVIPPVSQMVTDLERLGIVSEQSPTKAIENLANSGQLDDIARQGLDEAKSPGSIFDFEGAPTQNVVIQNTENIEWVGVPSAPDTQEVFDFARNWLDEKVNGKPQSAEADAFVDRTNGRILETADGGLNGKELSARDQNIVYLEKRFLPEDWVDGDYQEIIVGPEGRIYAISDPKAPKNGQEAIVLAAGDADNPQLEIQVRDGTSQYVKDNLEQSAEEAIPNGHAYITKKPESEIAQDVAINKDFAESLAEVENKAKIPQEISEAQSFQELKDIIQTKGNLTGSDGRVYPADELTQLIEGIENLDPAGFNQLPQIIRTEFSRNEGLRDKVDQLFAEKILAQSKSISDATSLDELKEIIRAKGGVQGNNTFFPANEIIANIEVLENLQVAKPSEIPDWFFSTFTRTDDLRATVQRIIKAEPEKVPTGPFKKASNFEELYQALASQGEIQGTRKNYTPGELAEIIEWSRRDPQYLDAIPRTDELRAKVIQLREDEPLGVVDRARSAVNDWWDNLRGIEKPCVVGFNLVPTVYAATAVPCPQPGFFDNLLERLNLRKPSQTAPVVAPQPKIVEDPRAIVNALMGSKGTQDEIDLVTSALVVKNMTNRDIAILDQAGVQVANEAKKFDYVIISGDSRLVTNTILSKHGVDPDKIIQFDRLQNGAVYKVGEEIGNISDAERTALTRDLLVSKGVDFSKRPSFLLVDEISDSGYKATAYLDRFSQIEGVGNVEYAALSTRGGRVIDPSVAGTGDFTQFTESRLQQLSDKTFLPSLDSASSKRAYEILGDLALTLGNEVRVNPNNSFQAKVYARSNANRALDRIYPERVGATTDAAGNKITVKLPEPCPISFDIIPTAYAQENPCKPGNIFEQARDKVTGWFDNITGRGKKAEESLVPTPVTEGDKNAILSIERLKKLPASEIGFLDKPAATIANEAKNFDYAIVSGDSRDIALELLKKHGVNPDKIIEFDNVANSVVYKQYGPFEALTDDQRLDLLRQALAEKGVKLDSHPTFLIVDDHSETGGKAISYLRKFNNIPEIKETKYAVLTTDDGRVLHPELVGTDFGGYQDVTVQDLRNIESQIFIPALSKEESQSALALVNFYDQYFNVYHNLDQALPGRYSKEVLDYIANSKKDIVNTLQGSQPNIFEQARDIITDWFNNLFGRKQITLMPDQYISPIFIGKVIHENGVRNHAKIDIDYEKVIYLS